MSLLSLASVFYCSLTDPCPSSFAIIVFSTLFLLITAGGSVMLLMTIGDTKLPSTLNLAIGTNMKRD